ncbi:hypothetical protein AW115_23420 [Escherichia coli]|nr:hypothetical protein AW066_22655 [Escherichia coli]OTE46332.1 hypothetical protein AW115_23420 [Escherichia coli]
MSRMARTDHRSQRLMELNCIRDCTILAAAGLLASTRKSYNRAKSESALLVHFSSISVEPVTDCQY